MIPLYPRHPIHDATVPCKTDYFLIVSLPSYPEATKGDNERLLAVEETQEDAVILLQLLQEKKNKKQRQQEQWQQEQQQTEESKIINNDVEMIKAQIEEKRKTMDHSSRKRTS